MNPEHKEVPKVEYTPDELAWRAEIIRDLCRARDIREQAHPELDGMTYTEYYESNRKKDLAYIPPKKNKYDIRISTGIVRDKDKTLTSTLLNLNLQPDVEAFDEDDLAIVGLGDALTDLTKKTRENENYDKKRPIIYRELVAQGDVFVQEIWVDDFREMPLEEIAWEPQNPATGLEFAKRLKRVFSGPAVRMVPGKNVYMADIRTEYVEDQPMCAVLKIHKRDKAQSMYGRWDRWKNVPRRVETVAFEVGSGATYKDWNLVQVNDDEVAELMVFCPQRNRFQIMLNGVMMLPHNYPLSAICRDGEMPMAQGKLEPISGFAYSKSQPSSAKVDEELLNEFTALMVKGARQGRTPPMGSSGKHLPPDIFREGTVTPDIRKDQVFPILPQYGLTSADFSFYELIRAGIDAKTVNAAYAGEAADKPQTAYEISELKNQQMLKLGLAVDGVVNLERRLTWLRISHGILGKFTEPTDVEYGDVEGVRKEIKKSYRSVTVDGSSADGKPAVKMYRMVGGRDQYPTVREQEQEEEDLSAHYGKDVRVTYLSAEELRYLKCRLFVRITPTPKQSDDLQQMMFVRNVQTAAALFGVESLNLDYIKDRWAAVTHEDPSRFFRKTGFLDLAAQVPPEDAADGGPPGPSRRPERPVTVPDVKIS